MYRFDYLVFIGRFQPFHNAHLETIEIALQHSKNVILVLGSAQIERTPKNPFLTVERVQMILTSLSTDNQQRICFSPIVDVYNDQKWVTQIKQHVEDIVPLNAKIGLIGHFKDESSYYLKLFPEWEMISLDSLQHDMSATPIREAFYTGKIESAMIPEGTEQFLNRFKQTQSYVKLKASFSEEQ